ncbi:MAG: sn-glycerol-3-phosphate ABC transporter ATP-binding protein UgpC [Pseudotabrizicola sp.]|uniref:sn-glycerol-3-phosphate ABC transporter ATP-binding protein UgpC n=1 Tax=Pseudotabrizicola sp. TaxID=2939647 RepID=UPI00272129F2|nr:sn-glycerol-3-phosphate ABC transporter ATP-binding protein UgpC [Pseudotabrizicola sp.]MDO8884895.1 sn-glycerol-3-phosphate ABC transporter ATP-binding protein UgpC [Pseudotabrizicola sp.]MDP2081329.1 sn-glycerol-3-phosphate ABC transporter ATP-binding protein UgpC [Pseudotabrizicola sp.]MDZ7576052.1 sn-glycerol-3-phosphate ABC transporter ATP-binding protein UgpC [Pseudotabrizicola sp.]
MANIQLNDLRKSYAGQEVIHGITMNISNGEFVVIVGPSGCGKSTLLRMVAGLEGISAGTISIGDRVVNDLEPRERDIAMVFQNYALYPHMSVRENMAYGLKIARMPAAEIDARVAKAAAILELEPYLDRKPRALSGGQRQRVAMGRALVREPAAFLLDEPLSNLDAKLRVQMRLQIKDLHQTTGQTMLYVTHDQVEAMTLADRLIVMNKGVADQIATPHEVYMTPASEFVAGFIGSPAMNIFTVQAEAGVAVLPGGQRLPLSGLPASGEVRLGLRPEDMEIVDAGTPSIPVVLRSVEWLGADAFGYGVIEGSDVLMTLRLPGSTVAARGDRLHVAPAEGRMHLFSKETGKRL